MRPPDCFPAYLDAAGVTTITVDVALQWVQRPDADPTSSVWARRMTVVRGFARHMSGIDPATEIPPVGLIVFRQHRRPPFIYSANDVEALMAQVPRLVPTPLRAATFATMIGLLAATGMRIGEVIALERGDIDWADLDTEVISAFLDHLETDRHNSARSRNARLAALR
ncbi:tyrosine-type recombinase/integrase [Rhodococcus opacus]|uniref:tyrosine-type recombinase/integrase n=1 Tax=Rhodococcus opacus TaxID=37919 RepID=UPI0029C5879D|nr:tyrosine-type recombinase/integrase [Rhodococcus opacus]MDX5961993.1 tyrosine-type recombinase/integrase [Rhodococcus opacus]